MSAGAEDAELVALGVGQDGPGHVGRLTDVDRLGAELAEAGDLGGVVVLGEGGDVEVDAVLGGLRVGQVLPTKNDMDVDVLTRGR